MHLFFIMHIAPRQSPYILDMAVIRELMRERERERQRETERETER